MRRLGGFAAGSPGLVTLLLLAGCGTEPVLDCESGDVIKVDCRFQNPEDLAPAPDGRLLVSQFGGMFETRPGSIAIYDPESRELQVLFPYPGGEAPDDDFGGTTGDGVGGDRAAAQDDLVGTREDGASWDHSAAQDDDFVGTTEDGAGGDRAAAQDNDDFGAAGGDGGFGGESAFGADGGSGAESTSLPWGRPGCPFPDVESFAPHGIDIELRDDGRRALAVVNHGGRESIEMFEVDDRGGLAWRGCVEAPEEGFFNDVVLLRDGGFWVTHMFPKSVAVWSVVKSALGIDTGWVYSWRPGAGFSKLPGSDAPFPNGVEKSADERYLYLNTSSSAGIRKIDATTGALVASRELAPLDNSTWGEDGRLLVASLTGSPADQVICQNIEQGNCGMPFEILALDPDDLADEVLVAHQGPPMGGVTVALERNGILYLGTFAGDRIGMVAR